MQSKAPFNHQTVKMCPKPEFNNLLSEEAQTALLLGFNCLTHYLKNHVDHKFLLTIF